MSESTLLGAFNPRNSLWSGCDFSLICRTNSNTKHFEGGCERGRKIFVLDFFGCSFRSLTFDKYRDAPPISIAILLQKYAALLAESSIYTTNLYHDIAPLNHITTLQPENITYINFCFRNYFPPLPKKKVHVSYKKYFGGINFSIITFRVFVCDSENYMENVLGNYLLGKSHFSYMK